MINLFISSVLVDNISSQDLDDLSEQHPLHQPKTLVKRQFSPHKIWGGLVTCTKLVYEKKQPANGCTVHVPFVECVCV